MRKYSGVVSILILIGTFLFLQVSIVEQNENLGVSIIAIGYLASAFASWFSTSGPWRKVSAIILILLPVGYLAFILLFAFAMSDF
ncbi:hypothetical protein ACOI1C_12800 [Bacillus sp. DJP31]|uniref:hypothetical protein n=1 Tax=Bacillus sp. DJP31 TaxID=3409789 RepID=UPI003BB7A16E